MSGPPRPPFFYLSYAHSASAHGHDDDSDPLIRVFFRDLSAAVVRLLGRGREGDVGFFDQQIPLGLDLKRETSAALGAAQVLVPLYSPRYFRTAWSLREQAAFLGRLRTAAVAETDRRILPVIWTPFLRGQAPPQMQPAEERQIDTVYGENGLRALCRLSLYQDAYREVVDRLGSAIATVVEEAPLDPSTTPDLDEIAVGLSPGPTFQIALLEPASPFGAGRAEQQSLWWTAPEQPVLDYAGTIAERLGMSCRLKQFARSDPTLADTCAIVFIDPWILDEIPEAALQADIARLPEWVWPVVLDVDRASAAEQTKRLADRVAAAVEHVREGPPPRLHTMGEVARLVPGLVAKLRRIYLRGAPVYLPEDAAALPRPPRLQDAQFREDEGGD